MFGKRLSRALAVVTVASLVMAVAALASSVDEAIVDATAQTGSVTLAPGGSGAITIDLTVTGNQVGTATFKVDRDWTLAGGIFTGSNPETFTVNPRVAQDAPTTFSTTGTVSVSSTQGAGTFVLEAEAFGITNSNPTGAKLSVGQASSYSVTVSTPPSDTTPPVISPNVSGTLGNDDWYVSDVTVSWSVSDPESTITSTSGCDSTTISADTAGLTLTCSASSSGGSNSQSITIKRDATAPTISGSASPSANSFSWNNTDVTVSYTCIDGTSGIASCSSGETLSGEGSGQSSTGTAIDNAGNSNSATVSDINIDKTPPEVSLVGGPADGGTYYFGFVPTAPTCSASDGLSGIDGACSVSGYGLSVGNHTVTASAVDKAGNGNSDSATYSVLRWTTSGFYAPVDMGDLTPVLNTIKGGQTVPLKFELFAGATELKSTSYVKFFTAQQIACNALGPVSADAIEIASTGGTSLRFDATGDQFIQNWQTPKTKNTCYAATVGFQDDSSITAYFMTK